MEGGSWLAPAAAIVTSTVAGVWGLFVWWMRSNADLVNELRKALDRGRIRENGLVVCCDLLIFAIDHMDEQTPAIVELRARAHAVLVDARRHTHGRGDQ